MPDRGPLEAPVISVRTFYIAAVHLCGLTVYEANIQAASNAQRVNNALHLLSQLNVNATSQELRAEVMKLVTEQGKQVLFQGLCQ